MASNIVRRMRRLYCYRNGELMPEGIFLAPSFTNNGIYSFTDRSVSLVVLAIILSSTLFGRALGQTSIASVQHGPSNWESGNQTPPEQIYIRGLERDGVRPNAASLHFSKFVHIGCFDSDFSITKDSEQDRNFDPATCVDVCLRKMPFVDPQQLIVAVHGPRCGCAADISVFVEVPRDACDFSCRDYQNPICGGSPTFWGAFKAYDYQSMSAQGAYDPWRKMFFSIVAISESFFSGKLNVDDQLDAERYYLHTVDTVTGHALFQYQTRLPGLLHGLEYDLDSSRLVAILTPAGTGRVKVRKWEYYFFVIQINATVKTFPNISWNDDWQLVNKLDMNFAIQEDVLALTGNSAINSKNGQDMYMFVTIAPAITLTLTQHMIYFFDIPSGRVIMTQNLDFKVLELFCNQKYGDVSAVLNKRGSQLYASLALVYYSDVEATKKVQWLYDPVFPTLLVNTAVLSDAWIQPGSGTSDHLYNKSYVWTRNYSNDYFQTREPRASAALLVEINIRTRTFENWCDKVLCLGTVDYRIPFSQIYNREPGIPLSLPAPVLVSATFSIEGSPLVVVFSRSTLTGAVPIDTTGDVLPDAIDYSTQLRSSWDCAKVFDDASAALIGDFDEGVACTWFNDYTINIIIPKGKSKLEVGDQIFLRRGVIYSIPVNGEYSQDAVGGIQVGLPDPLYPPNIVAPKSLSVDFCDQAIIDASDSFYTGRDPVFKWSFVSIGDSGVNPDRVFNATKLAMLKKELQTATDNNIAKLVLSPNEIEPSTTLTILLEVTSRWGLTSNQTIAIVKTEYPAPKVVILGPAERIVNRTTEVTIMAEGTPSTCNGDTDKLFYSWTETSGKLNLDDYPQILTTSRTLIIPPMTLQTDPIGPASSLNVYNFTVEVWAQSRPDIITKAEVGILVQRSVVYVVLTREDRLHTRGTLLIIDARSSQDADDPTPPDSTFKGSFDFYCLNPQMEPCWLPPAVFRRMEERREPKANDRISLAPPERKVQTLPTTGFRGYDLEGLTSFGEYHFGRKLQNAYLGHIEGLQTCRTDINLRITDGGRTFSTPVFLPGDLPYCRWARGVLMVQTNNFTLGAYRFGVEITSTDGRKAKEQIVITMTDMVVPVITLTVDPQKLKISNTQEIRVTGTIESTIDPKSIMSFKWQIFRYGKNPDYDPELALQAANNPDFKYVVQEYTYLDTGALFDFNNITQFYQRPDQPNLVIKKNVLQAATSYKIRCTVTVTKIDGSDFATGYGDVKIVTAGDPPSQGMLIVDPINASMDVGRTLSAPDWIATDLPLRYSFGYIKFLGNLPTDVFFTSASLPVSSYYVDMFPLGQIDSGWSLQVFADIQTAEMAVTRVYQTVTSYPPANPDALIQQLINTAKYGDAERVSQVLSMVVSLVNAPVAGPGQPKLPLSLKNDALFTELLDVLDTRAPEIPATAPLALGQIQLVASVVAAGKVDARTMDSLETGINTALLNNLYDIHSPALFTSSFYALGDILPGDPIQQSQDDGVVAQSVAGMYEYGNIVTQVDQYVDAQENSLANQQMVTMMMSTLHGRLKINDVERGPGQTVITDCPSAYCDQVFRACIIQVTEELFSTTLFFICCAAPNAQTLCNSPPCWFRGGSCPMQTSRTVELVGGQRRLADGRKPHSGYFSVPRMLEPHSGRQLGSVDRLELVYGDKNTSSVPNPYIDSYNPFERPFVERRAQSVTRNGNLSLFQSIAFIEKEEKPILLAVQKAVSDRSEKLMQANFGLMEQELSLQAMPLGESMALRAKLDASAQAVADLKYESERANSQMITRVAVLRDAICKKGILQMTFEPPLRFVSPGYIIWFGKTTNLSNVNPAFQFPDSFAVPPNAPEEPTPESPVSSFSFIYMEYLKNIYSWSDSSPPGNNTVIITLIVMRASTADMIIENQTEPIRLFADQALYSSALCMFWDRFAANTAGGAWSYKGLLNDGDSGCVATHLGDIGLALDGRKEERLALGDANSFFLDTTIDVGMNFSQMAVLGFILSIGTICALWGYIRDELVREARRLGNGKDGQSYNLPGDGLTSAINVDDPIAYQYTSQRNLFLARTYFSVLIRDHAFISSLMYHRKFTRPQRILVLGVLMTCILAINAAIYGNPRAGFLSSAQYFSSGVVSGLLAFPVYNFVAFMFATRPFAPQKRLVKKSTNRSQFEAVAKKRQAVEAISSLHPSALGLPMYRPPPSGADGGLSMLALPPPSAPLPGSLGLPGPVASTPMGPYVPFGIPSLPALPVANMSGLPGLALPPTLGLMPPPVHKRGPMGLPSLPGLPPLPKLHALPGGNVRPPPPPPKTPPSGYITPQFQQLDYYDERSLLNRPPPPPKTLGMPQLAASKPFGSSGDIERPPPPPGTLLEDPSHGAFPADASGESVASAISDPTEMDVVAGRDVEAAATRGKHLRTEVEHTMVPRMQGPPPKLPGAFGMGAGGRPDVPTVQMPGFGGSFGGDATPLGTPHSATRQSLLPGRLDGTPRTPSMAPPSTPGSSNYGPPMTPPGPPPMPGGAFGITRGIVHRGEPFVGLPPPFKPPLGAGVPSVPSPPPLTPPGVKRPTGVPPPAFQGPPPSGPGMSFGGTGLFGQAPPPRPPPPPPPPPKEDDATFVRRTRLHYMDRAAQLHQEILLSDEQDAAWTAPDWVYTLTSLMPYLASGICILLHIFINLAFTLKYTSSEEEYYIYASCIGFGLILGPLEFIRSAITTIVELRKYEIRRAQAGGDFLRSKIRNLGAGKASSLLTQKKAAPKMPALPETATKVPTRKMPPPRPPPSSGAALGNLPIVQPPPLPPGPLNSSSAPLAVPQMQQPLGLPPIGSRSPIASSRSAQSGIGQRGGVSLLPGRLDGSGTGTFHMGMPALPPGGRPGSPAGSVTSVTASLTEKLKASRVAAAGPPPPGSRPGSSTLQRGGLAPKPPTPPPKGTLAQTRNQARQQGLQK